MKPSHIILILLAFLAPILVFGRESMITDRVQATIETSGNWQLTDNEAAITWQGEWIADHLMKVTGTDDSCFIIGENQDGMVQLDCQNLKEISILLSY